MLAPYPLPVGYVYETRPVAIDRARQLAKLSASGVDPEVHGDRLDLTFLGLPILDALMEPGVPLQGQVHVYQRFMQQAPIARDTDLHMRGEITAIEPVAKGEVVRWRFLFSDHRGRDLVIVDRAGLRPQASGAGGAGGSGATDFLAPPDEDATGFEEVWQRTLQPAEVARYSSDGRNRIHSDTEIARQFGFRAPIAAGLMAVHYYLEAMARRGAADTMDLEIWFKRPMFWDERLTLQDKTHGGRLTAMRIENQAGKTASQARINGYGV
ncbi:MAG: MaoC/PaaZ C-terminal domain-containing protein [Proteobacteria bacterium]|nr:MaoC/PaaZ C-terminal domain-containing protein [Pseudomonadota bacterium]